MRVYVDTEVLKELGAYEAVILEYIFTKAPHYNIQTKLNISSIARDLPISLSTVQRLIKDLLDKGYIEKADNLYALSKKFFNTFEEYKTYTYE
jgi:DNA-binding MarR family transcriptional regulator